MSDSSKKVVLEVIAKGKIYEIPFPSVEYLDGVTVQFQNRRELTKLLFDDENYPVDSIRIKYSYKSPKRDEVVSKYLKVKYSVDNYDSKKMRDVCIAYLQKNGREAKSEDFGLLFVLQGIRSKNNNSGDFTDYEIAAAVNKLWDKGYKSKRDIYFALKSRGENVPVLPVETFYQKLLKVHDLVKLDGLSSDDEYVQYLQSLSKRNEESRVLAMEQISMFDLEDLERMSVDNLMLYGRMLRMDIQLDDLVAHMLTLSPVKRQQILNDICALRDIAYEEKHKIRCKR